MENSVISEYEFHVKETEKTYILESSYLKANGTTRDRELSKDAKYEISNTLFSMIT